MCTEIEMNSYTLHGRRLSTQRKLVQSGDRIVNNTFILDSVIIRLNQQDIFLESVYHPRRKHHVKLVAF